MLNNKVLILTKHPFPKKKKLNIQMLFIIVDDEKTRVSAGNLCNMYTPVMFEQCLMLPNCRPMIFKQKSSLGS